MATLRSSEIVDVTLRIADTVKLRELRIIVPVTVATDRGSAVQALLCRPLRQPPHPATAGVLMLVYYDPDGDEMVVQNVDAKQVGWLGKIGGV